MRPSLDQALLIQARILAPYGVGQSVILPDSPEAPCLNSVAFCTLQQVGKGFVDSFQDLVLKLGKLDNTGDLESVVLVPHVNLVHIIQCLDSCSWRHG